MTSKNNENVNMKQMIATFVAYIQQEIEYTSMKIKAMKEWQVDDCACLGCDISIASMSEDEAPSFDDEFSKEWL